MFSTKKKLQRDRDAGLVFRWRGGYRSNRGGSTIAFLMTSLVFAAGVIMLNVAKPSTVPNRYRAEMIQLGEMDDDLTWWVEKNSPDLPVWRENGDTASESRVSALLKTELDSDQGEVYRYEDVEIKPVEIDNEEIYSLKTESLPPLRRFQNAKDENSDSVALVEWKISVSADDDLKKRLPSGLEYGGFIPERWRGSSVRFAVAVDAGGKVLDVNPTVWNEDDVVKGLENWVQTFRFKPIQGAGADEIVTGVISLGLFPMVDQGVKEVER
jgi:hypothetical protein